MTDTDDVVLTGDDLVELDQLALELTKRKENITAETERVKEIEAIMRRRLPRGATTLGATTVTVARGRQAINADRLREAFPETVFPELYQTVPRALADIRNQLGEGPLRRAGVIDEGIPGVRVR